MLEIEGNTLLSLKEDDDNDVLVLLLEVNDKLFFSFEQAGELSLLFEDD